MHNLKQKTQDGPKTPKKPKALLIEDDRTTRRVIRSYMKDDCDLIVAGNMHTGANICNTLKPDIIFLDIELPDGSGHQFLEWAVQKNPDAFVVMMSGHCDNNNVMKAVESGARGFIAKPFDEKKMQFFLNECMEA